MHKRTGGWKRWSVLCIPGWKAFPLDAGMFLQEEMFPDLLVAPIFPSCLQLLEGEIASLKLLASLSLRFIYSPFSVCGSSHAGLNLCENMKFLTRKCSDPSHVIMSSFFWQFLINHLFSLCTKYSSYTTQIHAAMLALSLGLGVLAIRIF